MLIPKSELTPLVYYSRAQPCVRTLRRKSDVGADLGEVPRLRLKVHSVEQYIRLASRTGAKLRIRAIGFSSRLFTIHRYT
jgi:hypothetical protein